MIDGLPHSGPMGDDEEPPAPLAKIRRPGRSKAARMERELDSQLMEALKGQPLVTAEGQPVIGPDGKQMRTQPSASVMREARMRLAELRSSGGTTSLSPVARIMESMTARIRKPSAMIANQNISKFPALRERMKA